MQRLLIALALGASLAACNTIAPPPPAPEPAKVAVSPQGADLPAQGPGCAGHIARYRAVQEQDKAMGHVADSVYSQIKGEIAGAEAQCAAGHEAQAEAMIRASEAKHGYPTGI